MTRAVIIGKNSQASTTLQSGLARYDVTCFFTSYQNGLREAVASRRPDILIVNMWAGLTDADARELLRKVRKGKGLPVLAIVPPSVLDTVQPDLDIDDFLVEPYGIRELVLRIGRLLRSNQAADTDERIRHEGLAINLSTCEVTVAGVVVELTFKEYELLKLLAASPGRVFTREALLDKIWGYDYFGGDRTVDVHVRRLRSKIEESGHTFIETVRNIGYRFKSAQ